MKNKVLTYLLFAIVTALWGYIIYLVVAAVQDKAPPPPQTGTRQAIQETDLGYYTLKDTGTLYLDYRSPVHGDVSPLEVDDNTDIFYNEADYDTYYPEQEYIAPEPEPNIVYMGFIENENNKKRVALLTIDEVQYMMGANEIRQDINIQHIAADHIKVIYNGKTKTIYK